MDNAEAAGAGIVGIIMLLVWLGLVIGVIAGMWKTFEKAGQPGWACLVPIYNLYILTKIADKEIIWFILYFVPLVNLIPAFMIPIAVAEKFGKGIGFALGLIFFPYIFYPMLGFGSAEYEGEVA